MTAHLLERWEYLNDGHLNFWISGKSLGQVCYFTNSAQIDYFLVNFWTKLKEYFHFAAHNALILGLNDVKYTSNCWYFSFPLWVLALLAWFSRDEISPVCSILQPYTTHDVIFYFYSFFIFYLHSIIGLLLNLKKRQGEKIQKWIQLDNVFQQIFKSYRQCFLSIPIFSLSD